MHLLPFRFLLLLFLNKQRSHKRLLNFVFFGLAKRPTPDRGLNKSCRSDQLGILLPKWIISKKSSTKACSLGENKSWSFFLSISPNRSQTVFGGVLLLLYSTQRRHILSKDHSFFVFRFHRSIPFSSSFNVRVHFSLIIIIIIIHVGCYHAF